ncbi:acyl-CoA thioesterase [Nocardia sp. NPDC101769]|uniref:acyl-CoA thioesterase n=1 Tax=Nocardia sp. NPDC101769 TaxID=3364333 RepID=UPI003812D4FC
MTGIVIERIVDWQDTDAAGHYHYSTVIRWVEAAEAALLDRFRMRWLFGRIPRVRYEVDYLDRLWFGDVVSIDLSVGELGRLSLRYDFVVTRISAAGEAPGAEPPTVAVRGALTAVHAPDPTGGAQPWPAAIAAVLRGGGAPILVPDRAGEPPTDIPSTSFREV